MRNDGEKKPGNNIREIVIEKLVYGGNGLGRSKNNKTVFVKNAYPGERVLGKILKIKKDFEVCSLYKVLNRSESRITPLCKHFYECGGCDWLDFKYKSQLNWKEEILKEQLKRIGKIENNIEKIIYDDNLYYRNRMEFIGIFSGTNLKFGMYKKESKDKVHIENCFLCSEKMILLKEKIEKKINTSSLEVGEKKKITHLVIRENSLNENMIIIMLNKKSYALIKFFESIKNEFEKCSFVIGLNNYKKIVLAGEILYSSSDKPFIQEVDEYKYTIHPFSFFQNNKFLLKNMIYEISELIENGKELLELYCGNGFFSIPFSKKFGKIISVENSPGSIDSLKNNLELNDISNVFPIESDVFDFLSENEKKYENIFIDPPRMGCKNLVEKISKKVEKNIYYLSCNPSMLAKDLNRLVEEGFEIKNIILFDLFPNTYHIESFVKLSRK